MRSRSPEYNERRVRQKVEVGDAPAVSQPRRVVVDSATDLALDHLSIDTPQHPLYARNVDQVLDAFCSATTLQSLVRDPLADLMGLVERKKVVQPQEQGYAALRHRLLMGFVERIITTTAESMRSIGIYPPTAVNRLLN